MPINKLSHFFLVLLLPFCGKAQTTNLYTTPGQVDWVVPACVFTVTVQTWGGGGAGGGSSATDRNGGGGGGAGSSTNGGNAATLVCYGSVAGGSGGSAVGGAGGNGASDLGINTQSFNGNPGVNVGGAGGGALVHLRDWLNSWITRTGGVGARGEVRLTYGGCSLLPVTMSSFVGECDGDSKEFKWETSSEQDNDYFTLEHSTNGLDFEPVSTIDGAGTSNEPNSYSVGVTDGDRFKYYRLTQTDINGVTRTWNTIATDCDNASMVFSVYPNPAQNELFISLDQKIEGSLVVLVYDDLGKTVQNMTVRPNQSNELKINLEKLATGNFVVEVWSNDQSKRMGIGRFTKK